MPGTDRQASQARWRHRDRDVPGFDRAQGLRRRGDVEARDETLAVPQFARRRERRWQPPQLLVEFAAQAVDLVLVVFSPAAEAGQHAAGMARVVGTQLHHQPAARVDDQGADVFGQHDVLVPGTWTLTKLALAVACRPCMLPAAMPLDPSPSNPWRTVSSTVLYRNPWTRLVEDTLEGPGGQPGLFGYFAVKDGVLVVPLFPDRSIVVIRQWRYVYGCSSWEVPCGSVESGETIEAAALRELAEEGGLRAERWTPMGSMHASDCRVGGLLHCLLAEDLSPLDLPLDDTEIDLVRERVPLAEAVAAVHDGTITHIASAYLLLRVERLLCERDRGLSAP